MFYRYYDVVLALVCFSIFVCVAAPTFVNAATLQLSWSDNSQDEDGFFIERKEGTGETYSLIATTGANATSYSDANLASNTAYCYRVNAFNSAGSSGYTNEACATTSDSTSPPPTTTTDGTSQTAPPPTTTTDGTSQTSPPPTTTTDGTSQTVMASVLLSYNFEDGRYPSEERTFNAAVPPAILVDPDGNHFLRMTASPSDCGPAFATICPTVRNEYLLGSFDNVVNNRVTYNFSYRIHQPNQGNLVTQFYQTNGLWGHPNLVGGWPVAAWVDGRTGEAGIDMKNPAPWSCSGETPEGPGSGCRPTGPTLTHSWPLVYDNWVKVSLVVTFHETQGTVDIYVDGQYQNTITGRSVLPTVNNTTYVHIEVYGQPGIVDFDDLSLITGSSAPSPNPSTTSTLQDPFLGVQASSPGKATPTTSSSIVAVLLGQTEEDIVGTTTMGADGIKDVRIQLSGVSSTISIVRITDGSSGIWETPFNGQNWIVAIRPQSDPSIVDLFFDYWQPGSSYTVALTFADGTTQTVQASAQTATAVQLSKTVTILSASANSTTVQPSFAISKIGLFRADAGEWTFDLNGNGQGDGCSVDSCIRGFGQTGDLPVTKNINNHIVIGVFRQGTWMFDGNANDVFDGCSVDECDNFGITGDLPVTGDWVGSGNQAVGVFRPSTGEWFLDANVNGQWDGCNADKCSGPFGGAGELPVIGDWNGAGRTGIGVFRPSTGEWFLDMNGNGQWDGCSVDKCFGPFGADGDLPVSGDWSGTGQAAIGVFRPSTGDWLLDINGNGNFDGCGVDVCWGPMGQPGDLPVVGQW